MFNYLETPAIPAVYILYLDDLFYIGSTINLQKRIGQHNSTLQSGRHKNKRLSHYFQENKGTIDFDLTYTEYPNATSSELVRMEETMIAVNIDNPKMCNVWAGAYVRVNGRSDDIVTYGQYQSRYWKKLSKEEQREIVDKKRAAYYAKTEEEQKEIYRKIAETKAGKSPEEKERLRKLNGINSKAYWDSLTDEEREARKLYKPVSIDGVEFGSLTEAEETLDIQLSHRLRKGEFKGVTYSYGGGSRKFHDFVDEEKNAFIESHKNTNSVVEFVVCDNIYTEFAAAQRDLGISKYTLLKRLDSDAFKDYKVIKLDREVRTIKAKAWFSLNTEEKKEYSSEIIKQEGVEYKKSVVVDGIRFESLHMLTLLLGLPSNTVYQRYGSLTDIVFSLSWSDLSVAEMDDFINKHQARDRVPTKVCIEGVTYTTMLEAANELGVSDSTIKRRCLSDNYPSWKIK